MQMRCKNEEAWEKADNEHHTCLSERQAERVHVTHFYQVQDQG